MAVLRAQVVFPGLSNKPEDVVVNTFHFDSASVDDAAVDVIRDQLVEFYNVATTGQTPGGPNIASYLSQWLSRATNACKIKVYNLADPLPRIVRERSWTLAAAAGSAIELPAEVALCASFYAGLNRPRYRGRVYLGPFTTVSGSDVVTGGPERATPTVALIDSVAGSLKRLILNPLTQNLAVYSQLDGVARVVTNGWVDDAWDTVRSRGQAATRRVMVP
jgi:hypothetical protein